MATSTSWQVGRRNVARFDERRNTSRVFGVTVEDVRAARRALEHFRHDDPELVDWIEAGHPRLTHDEHVRRFGGPYLATSTRRGRGRA